MTGSNQGHTVSPEDLPGRRLSAGPLRLLRLLRLSRLVRLLKAMPELLS